MTCYVVTQRGLHALRFFFQQGDNVRRGRGFIEERLRQPLLRLREQTALVQVHEAAHGGVGVRSWEPVCRYARRLAGLQREDERLPGVCQRGKNVRGEKIKEVPV
jgi:hypothetical protein